MMLNFLKQKNDDNKYSFHQEQVHRKMYLSYYLICVHATMARKARLSAAK